MSQTVEFPSFDVRVKKALADPQLKIALERTTGNARRKRAAAVAAWPEFAAARAAAAAIKDHAIDHMAYYLEIFERNALASGAQVHWARDSDEACRIVVDICKAAGAKTVTRSKSMLGEEIGLPHALEAAGIRRVETDLAEHIIQLANERPSHIIWPAAHHTKENVAELFHEHHRDKSPTPDIESMVASARKELRDDYFAAEVGISGANFLVAETGAICTITNEGNAELTTTPPRVHIVTAGIEKIVATTEQALQLTRLLVRAATGADFTQYTTFHCGPKRPGDLDGPESFHIVLVDHGRTRMLVDMPEMLRCLRCGACLNHCVVYRAIGGHAYAALSRADGLGPDPGFRRVGGIARPAPSLHDERPMPRGLPGRYSPADAVARLGEKSWRGEIQPTATRASVAVWAFAAARPKLYHLGLAFALPLMRLFARGGWIKKMPLASGWTNGRDLPKPPSSSFMAQYARRRNGK